MTLSLGVVLGFIGDWLRERRAFAREARIWRRDLRRQADWRLQELLVESAFVRSYEDVTDGFPISPFSGRELSEEEVPLLTSELAVWAWRVGDEELTGLVREFGFDFGQYFATVDPKERERRQVAMDK